MRLDTGIKLCGKRFINPLMNGAYINSKTYEDIKNLSDSSCGAIVVGSISIKPRKQNTGQAYWRHKEKFYSLNSYGLPNGGLPYFKDKLGSMVKLAHAKGKLLIANLVGFSDQEFIDLIDLAVKSEVDLIELNFSCPNVWDKDGKQKQILSFNPSLMNKTLDYIRAKRPNVSIGLKLSPMPPGILSQVATVINSSKNVGFVTATNSYPNALTSTGTRVKNEVVLAGLTGRALKPLSLGTVRQLRTKLSSKIDIVGCGGISSFNDVLDYYSAGAKAFQIATALVDEGPAVFDKILYQSKS